MKRLIRGRKPIMILTALAIAAVCLVGVRFFRTMATDSGELASGDMNSILSKIPAYTHDGTYVDTYDMGASGDYIDKTGAAVSGVVDELGGGMMMVYTGASAGGYENYRSDLKKMGYRLYADNDLNGNLFATYVTEENVVTLSYLPACDNQLSILVEPMRDLQGLKEENVYQNRQVENKAILLTCAHVGKDNGLCLLFQLCDGSFVIVDSGYGIGFYPDEKNSPDYQNAAKDIYQIMYHLAPDPDNIVVAAWFFTHPHYDHMGGLGPFADLYSDTVTVEKFVLNHPNRDTIQEMYDKWKGNGGKDNADANFTYVERMQQCFAKFDGAAVVEAHSGQKFYLRDAVIDVLCTWETQTEYHATNNITGEEYVSINQMNSASVILDVDLGGERTIVLGDCGPSSTAYLEKLYGSWLKSDMQTVAHHGFQGASPELNRYIDADVVLWPNQDISSHVNKKYNLPLLDADVIWEAGNHVTIIPLPYTGDGDVTRFEAPAMHGKTWEEVYPN